jgi:hypothetical protein
MMIAAALLAFLLGRVLTDLTGLTPQGAQPRSARWSFHCPLLGQWSLSSVKRLRALAQHGPDALLSRTADSLSRPYVLAVSALAPLGLVAPGPDVDAFTGGVVTALSAGFIVLVALGGLAIVRRILGS